MSKRETLIVTALFLASMASLTLSYQKRWIEGFTDTAFLSELFENVAHGDGPVTRIAASTYEASKLWGMTAELACQTPNHSPAEPLNYFRKAHPYFILYVTAPLLWLMSVDWALAGLMALSFVGLLFGTYILLRSLRVGAVPAMLFAMVVSVHPAWREAIWGQPYVDRLFLFFGFFFAWAIYRRNWYLAAFLATISVLINDRVGIICAAVTATSWLFVKNKDEKKILLLLSVLCAGFSAYTLFFYVTGYPSTESFARMGLHYYFESSRGILQVATFIVVNLLLFAGWGVFAWRELTAALIAMLPNILGNIGGAEKTGWATHYHSLYFPLLTFAVAIGLARRWNRSEVNDFRAKLKICGILLIQFVCLAAAPLDFAKSFDMDLAFSNWLPLSIVASWEQTAHRTKLQNIDKIVPEGVKVGTVEALMPALLENRHIDYYPVGIADDDYVVLPFTKVLGEIVPSGAVLYRSPEEKASLDRCLFGRLRDVGFDFSTAKYVDDVIVLSKKK